MSIVNPKYRGKYNAENADWLSRLIVANTYVQKTKEKTIKAEDGTETTETVNVGKPAVDLEKLFDFAEANAINARELYGDQVDRAGAAGRLRMTIGNLLRSAAKRRHGLNVDGKFVEAPAEFIGEVAKTENPDGSKIAKPAKEEAEAAA